MQDLINHQQILIQNVPGWENTTDPSYIKLKRLTGLTNITYQATNLHPSVPEKMVDVVYRVFGNCEGLIDRQKEHAIFKELGDKNQSPKCFAFEEHWRIEEFVRANHPSLEIMKEKQYRRLMAVYMASFHKIHLDKIPMDEAIIKKQLCKKKHQGFFEKIQKDELFNKEEKLLLEEFQKLLSDNELSYLKSILPNKNEVLCHNDLNNLNIFYCPNNNLRNKIKFIDFEYSAYNFAAFDIANFMNESHFNYSVKQEPFYEFIEENVFSIEDIKDFVSYYQAASLIDNEDLLLQLETSIYDESIGKPEDIIKNIIQIDEFQKLCEQTIFEVLSCQILSNWYWIIWSVVTCKAEGMQFNHLHYAKCRFDIYQQLKQYLNQQYNI